MNEPVLNVVIWALGTGLITGAVGAAIVLFRWGRQPSAHPADLPPDTWQRLDDLESAVQRLSDVEERLDAVEHLLTRQREAQRISRPDHREGA